MTIKKLFLMCCRFVPKVRQYIHFSNEAMHGIDYLVISINKK